MQALSADEEVLEKEYEGIPRLKSTLHIKSKPKTKHQKGTYRRGRRPDRAAAPATNDPQVLRAAALRSEWFDLDLTKSESFDLDFSVDDQQWGSVLEGSVLAPSQAQEDRFKAAEASRTSALAPRTQRGDASSSNGAEGLVQQKGGAGDDWEGPGAVGSRQNASNTLASRGGGEQVAARLQEAMPPQQQQGYSLMWYAQPH